MKHLTQIVSELVGLFADTSISKFFIPLIEEKHKKYLFESKKYKTLNDWFQREVRKNYLNQFNRNEEDFLSPCEAYLTAHEDINTDNLIQAKGKKYSLTKLVQNKIEDKYKGGTILVFHLCPDMYHRVRAFDNAKIKKRVTIPGTYWPVNLLGINFIKYLFCKNYRIIDYLETKHFGDVLQCEIGAFNVGSIKQNFKPNTNLKRGDFKSVFAFGGSTVILFFKKDKIKIDKNYLSPYDNKEQHYVFIGNKIGKCIQKGE